MTGLEQAAKAQAPDKICVYVLAANRLLREALGRVFKRAGFAVLGSTEELAVALEEVARFQPNVVLINASALQFDVAPIVLGVRRAAPTSPVVLFGAREERETFFRSIRAGVAGYVSSESRASDLVAAVRCAVRGEALCPPRLCLELFKYVARHPSLPKAALRVGYGLTRREQQVLPLISEGLTNKEIAARLTVSELTIKNHVGRILRKTGKHDRLSAAQAIEAVPDAPD